MKKISALSLIIVIFLMVTVNAENIVEIDNDSIVETSKTVSLNISTKNFSEGDDLTILVFKPAEDNSDPDTGNIVYVNQAEYSQNSASISFKLPDDAEGRYEIRMGGTGVKTYTSGAFYVTEFTPGDLNGDGLYDDNDAILILKVFLEIDEINAALNKSYYDLNSDGVINTKDALIVYEITQ